MSRRVVGLIAVAMAVVASIGLIVGQSLTSEASAKAKDQFQLDLIVQVPGPGPDGTPGLSTSGTIELVELSLAKGRYNVDSFFDISYVSNIGSSGDDGVSFKTTPNFDVFFEVDYKTSRGKIETEMVALSLRVNLNDPPNPQGAIDLVRRALEGAGGDIYYGHVTIIK